MNAQKAASLHGGGFSYGKCVCVFASQDIGSTDKFSHAILTHLFYRTSMENPPQSTTLRLVFLLIRTNFIGSTVP